MDLTTRWALTLRDRGTQIFRYNWYCYHCNHPATGQGIPQITTTRPCKQCHTWTEHVPWSNRWLLRNSVEHTTFDALELIRNINELGYQATAPILSAALHKHLDTIYRAVCRWKVANIVVVSEDAGDDPNAPDIVSLTPAGQTLLDECYDELDHRVAWLEIVHPQVMRWADEGAA